MQSRSSVARSYTSSVQPRTAAELDAALDHVRASPKASGTVELIVRRPRVGEREVVDRADLDVARGLVGDTWGARKSRRSDDGTANPDEQVTLMNARAIAAIAGERDRWPLAGDQLYVDFDLSADNVPPGTRLEVGTAVLEVSPLPHTGCVKFTKRYGSAATKWTNSPAGRSLNLRGINARIVSGGVIARGDAIKKL